MCERAAGRPRWRAGTLHNGKVDVDQSLWALVRRAVPLHIISAKLDEHIAAGHLDQQDKDARLRIFEEMSHVHRLQNPHADAHDAGAQSTDEKHHHMSEDELREELQRREKF